MNASTGPAAAASRRGAASLPRAVRRWVAQVAQIGRCVAGNVTLELAFFTPVAIFLLAGGYDFGSMSIAKYEIGSAAQAGANYGSQDQGTSTDIAGILEAARADAEDVDQTLDVSARQFCRCPDGVETACGNTCADGAYSPMYVEVTAQRNFDLMFVYPNISPSRTLSVTSAKRVR